jgi:CheY-like chemotaxis protein
MKLILIAMKNVLIVEDEEDIRFYLKMVVDSLGFSTLLAGEGEEALEKLNNNSVDLVITDYRMPKMDGARLSVLIKKKFPEIPIIFISTFGPRDLGIQDLVHAFLPKPFEPEQLEEKLREVFTHNILLTS